MTSKPVWNLQIIHQLQAAYSETKHVLINEISAINWRADGTSEVRPDGTIGITAGIPQNHLVPLSLLRSASEASWLEYGALYDGSTWDMNVCQYAHTLCRILGRHESSFCRFNDKTNPCETDSIVTLVRIKPGTTVLPHCGMTNRRLTLHWCLSGCNNVSIIVGDESSLMYGTEGSVIVFDDSFEHWIQHKGNKDTVIAAIFLSHPDFIL